MGERYTPDIHSLNAICPTSRGGVKLRLFSRNTLAEYTGPANGKICRSREVVQYTDVDYHEIVHAGIALGLYTNLTFQNDCRQLEQSSYTLAIFLRFLAQEGNKTRIIYLTPRPGPELRLPSHISAPASNIALQR